MSSQTDVNAVRNYLLYLEDPAKLVNPDDVSRLSADAKHASDPLDRLRAVTELQRLQRGDEATHRLGFITNAKTWATENNIPAESFLELGVDRATLREAGFDLKTPRRRGAAAGGRRAISKSAPVTAESIKVVIAAISGTFTLADVASTAGGSPMTVRKAVEELVREGAIERLGPTPNWSRQGRAPILFRAATPKSKRR